MGCTDVVVLERDKLTSGTTWHAAGLMVTFGSLSETSTEMRKYTCDLYCAARGGDRAVDGLQPGRLHRDGHRARPARGVPAGQRLQPLLRCRRARDLGQGSGRPVPVGPHRRRARRVLRERGRQGQSGRRDHGARQGSAPEGRDHHRRRRGDRRRSDAETWSPACAPTTATSRPSSSSTARACGPASSASRQVSTSHCRPRSTTTSSPSRSRASPTHGR